MSEHNPTDHRFRSVTDTDVRPGTAPSEQPAREEEATQATPVDTSEMTPRAPKNPHSRRNKTIAWLAGGALAIGTPTAATVAWATSQNAPKPKPTAEAPVTPGQTPEATTNPEAEIVKINVNYEAFDGWENKTQDEKDAACLALFDGNIENRIIPTATSTGSEAAQSYKDQYMVLFNLNKDKSDPRNNEVVIKAIDCITAVRSSTPQGKDALITQMSVSIETTPDYIDPEMITRYSGEPFTAFDELNRPWDAKMLEGKTTGFGNPLGQWLFEWHGKGPLPGYRLVSAYDGTGNVTDFGGVAPVVVDPAYENAPWK